MYSDWMERLNRVDWSAQFGDRATTMLARELCGLLGPNHSLTQRGNLTVKGRLIAEGGVQGLASYAVATANWVNNGANSYVKCRQASKRDGTLVHPPVEVTVYLPPGAGKDPNVRTGQVIQYMNDANGDAMVVGGSYLDDKIGATKMWRGDPGAIPAGWQAISGAAGKFARAIGGGVAKDDTGGAATHNHGGTTEEAETGISADLSGLTVGTATTGINISSHPGSALTHSHMGITASLGLESGPIDTTWLIGVEATEFDDLGHSITDAGHTHSLGGSGGGLDDPGHSHGITSDDWLPPWYGVGVWIERVN